jgi:hypothetical protein
VLTRWQAGYAAILVTLGACALVILDLTDGGFRRWWAAHPLTTDTVAGVQVLLITVLVVDQVVRRRQLRDRSQAVAAQSAIMMGQAARSARAVSAVLDGPGDRAAATDEVRTYMVMLLVGAPVLIDASISREFLEQAQHLGAAMLSALAGKAPPSADAPGARMDDAYQRLRVAAAPLLALLNPDELAAAGWQDPGSSGG